MYVNHSLQPVVTDFHLLRARPHQIERHSSQLISSSTRASRRTRADLFNIVGRTHPVLIRACIPRTHPS